MVDPRTTDAGVAQSVVDYYLAGNSVIACAKKFHIGTARAVQIIKANGTRIRDLRVQQDEKTELATLFKSGRNMKQISKGTGRSTGAVSRALHKEIAPDELAALLRRQYMDRQRTRSRAWTTDPVVRERMRIAHLGQHPKVIRSTKKICPVCGRMFLVIPARLKDHRGTYCSRPCRDKVFRHSDETIRLVKEARLRQICPKKDTKIEVALQEELLKRSISFLAHVPLVGCQPDIYLPDSRTVIFADGCYFHGCPEHCSKPSGPIPQNNMSRDSEQNQRLGRAGYSVFRFWEHEIKADAPSCIDKVIPRESTANPILRMDK